MSQTTNTLAERSRIFEAWHTLLSNIQQTGELALDASGTLSLDQKHILHALLSYAFRLEIILKQLAELKEVAPRWMATIEHELSHFRKPEDYTTQDFACSLKQDHSDTSDLVNRLKASLATIPRFEANEASTAFAVDGGDAYDPTEWIMEAHDAIFRALIHCNTDECSCADPHKPPFVMVPLLSHRNKTTKPNISVTIFINLSGSWEEVSIAAKKVVDATPLLTTESSIADSPWPEYDMDDIVGSLCTEIAHSCGRRLNYALVCDETNRLFRVSCTNTDFKWTKAISLQELLGRPDVYVSSKEKLLLATRLSYAIMHFFNAEWLRDFWSSANIKFPIRSQGLWLAPHMEAQAGQAVLFPNRQSCPFGHPYPYLVVLAIQLMEIHFKTSFADLFRRCGFDFEECHVQNDPSLSMYIRADKLFDHLERDGGLSLSDENFFKAVKNCLKKSLWRRLSVDELRMKIFQHVVRPLEAHLISSHKNISLLELDQIRTVLSIPQQPRQMQNLAVSTPQSTAGSSTAQVRKVSACTGPSKSPGKRKQSAMGAKGMIELFDDETLNDLK